MKNLVVDFKSENNPVLTPVEDTTYVVKLNTGVSDPKSLTVVLSKPDLSCRILCGYKIAGEDNIDFSTTVIHKAVRTNSETVIRGVLMDGGVSKYMGKIVIEKIAQGSSSNLDDKTLVVGEGTRNHSEPLMQIEANDVTASHASSTGRIDRDQLYYLQSRGMSSGESKNILLEAFLSAVEV